MKKGCLYWLVLGWWLEPILYLIKQTRIVVWIAAVAVLIGFLIMAGAFLVAMAFIFAVLAVLIIIASMIVRLIRYIHSRRTYGTDMEDLHAEEFEDQEEQYQPEQIEKQIPTPTKELEMSNEQALRYGSICNAFLEHQEEQEEATEQCWPKPITVCISQSEMVPKETKKAELEPAKRPEPTPVKKPEMSDEQALRYGLMCNAYIDHQEEMEQYEPHERNNEKGNIQDDL
nr:MAG TPA: Oxaloacetate decarboxylase, gamma chain [Bacteriophage sp.]